MSCCRSYCDQRLLWRHFTLCIFAAVCCTQRRCAPICVYTNCVVVLDYRTAGLAGSLAGTRVTSGSRQRDTSARDTRGSTHNSASSACRPLLLAYSLYAAAAAAASTVTSCRAAVIIRRRRRFLWYSLHTYFKIYRQTRMASALAPWMFHYKPTAHFREITLYYIQIFLDYCELSGSDKYAANVSWATFAGCNEIVMAALHSSCGHYICVLRFLLSFFFFISSPNLSRRRLDVYHTSTHGVALVRI